MKLLLIILGVIFSLIILLIGFISLSPSGMCGNDIHKIYPSPDSTLKAVVFQRDCGATSSFSTQISILPLSQKLGNEEGNAYMIDGHPESVAPLLEWKSNDIITIYAIITGSEYKVKNTVGWFHPVKVHYESPAI